MKKQILCHIILTIIISTPFFTAFSMPDEEITQKMIGTWKSVEEYKEDGIDYSYIEVITFSKSGRYRGYSEKLKNGNSIEYERFRGSFSIKTDRIYWEPKGDGPWSDNVTVSDQSLTFTDDDGGSMSYVKLSKK